MFLSISLKKLYSKLHMSTSRGHFWFIWSVLGRHCVVALALLVAQIWQRERYVGWMKVLGVGQTWATAILLCGFVSGPMIPGTLGLTGRMHQKRNRGERRGNGTGNTIQYGVQYLVNNIRLNSWRMNHTERNNNQEEVKVLLAAIVCCWIDSESCVSLNRETRSEGI